MLFHQLTDTTTFTFAVILVSRIAVAVPLAACLAACNVSEPVCFADSPG